MPVAVTLSSLKDIAASNDWGAILPELLLAGLAVLVLVLELLLPRTQRALIPALSLCGLAGILLGLGINFHTAYLNQDTFAGLLHHSEGGQFMRVFFVLTAILVCLLATVTLERQAAPRTEFYHLVIVITAALMLLAQSNHFVLFFVALETVTVGFYILVSYFRASSASLEGGLKYLILSALSSAILLFGIVLLYGVAGNRALPGATGDGMSFAALRGFLAANPDNFLANVGAVLVLAGVAFKIGAVPFQFWIPDVYQGAPTPVTAFLAVGSKAAGFAVLMILALDVFRPLQAVIMPALSLMAVATILVGNLAALTQSNVKRLMGLSGVSHAGYLLVGVIAAYREPSAVGAVYFYLLAYLLASFTVFAVMAHVSGAGDADQDLEHYANLARERPFLGAILAIGLGSLAGIPPLAGFMGKLLVFIFAFKAGLYGLLTVALVGVVISIYYYFGWIRAAFFPSHRALDFVTSGASLPAIPRVSRAVATAMVLLAAASLVLGFYQGPLGAWLIAR
jgi:NADH-quinone oxidoreductase subunit N